MRELIQAVAGQLNRLFAGAYPVYWGRMPQEEKRPCFYILPPKLERRELPCGRVWRQAGLELHFYGGGQGLAGLALQEQVGERLLRELSEIKAKAGGRSFRGRGLGYQPGERYLSFSGRYEYYTTREQERLAAGESWPARELMGELIFVGDDDDLNNDQNDDLNNVAKKAMTEKAMTKEE